MKKYLNLISIISVLISGSAFAGNKTIRIALPSWDGGQYIAYHLGAQLEKKFARPIDYVSIEGDPMWVELDKDDGVIDIFPDLWMPNQEKNWNEYIDSKNTVASNNNPYIGKQGFYIINNPTSEGSTSIKDFQEQGVLSYLDTNKNGLAEYWPGAPGWHATIFSQAKMNSYGLSEKFEEIDASSDQFLDVLEKRYLNGKSLVFYYWEPDWVHAKYNTDLVNETKYTDGCRKIVDPTEDANWLSLSKFNCAFPDSDVWVVFRDEFLKEKKLKAFLLNYKVDLDELQSSLLKSKEEGISLRDIAVSR